MGNLVGGVEIMCCRCVGYVFLTKKLLLFQNKIIYLQSQSHRGHGGLWAGYESETKDVRTKININS